MWFKMLRVARQWSGERIGIESLSRGLIVQDSTFRGRQKISAGTGVQERAFLLFSTKIR